MKKTFNIAGVCYPHIHYMMDNSDKLRQVLNMVERGDYFTINRPRQYGKTTMLYFLAEALRTKEAYLPVELNFQGIDEQWHQSDTLFAQLFFNQLADFFEYQAENIASFFEQEKEKVVDMDTLSKFITRLGRKLNRKIIVVIDEVDASSKFEPFLNFLGMLRTKYLARFKPQHTTFHSVVLAGVHDIKSLKQKIRNQDTSRYNSPWNIAVDFKVDMSFHPKEIAPMLVEYCEAEQVMMDIPAIADRLYYHTSGYPFLISKLCRIIVEDILPQKEERSWILNDIEESVRLLLRENNTNFDSVIKNLENNPDLYDVVHRIVIGGTTIAFNQYNPVIFQGLLYGVFKRNGRISIHNRIYEQLIYDYMASNLEIKLQADNYNFINQFVLPNNQLDFQKILLKFQHFIKEQYSEKDRAFLEREWRLVFLAFIKPIINGSGYDFKETQVSEEKRLDIVVTYYQHRYIIELKIWRGPKKHEEGLSQLTDYLSIHNANKGYLLIFDPRQKKSWEAKPILHKKKEIFAIWV